MVQTLDQTDNGLDQTDNGLNQANNGPNQVDNSPEHLLMGLVLRSWTISLFWTGSHYNYYTDTNCYPNCTIPVHRPYASDIEVTVLSFSNLPHVEFTLYELTLD